VHSKELRESKDKEREGDGDSASAGSGIFKDVGGVIFYLVATAVVVFLIYLVVKNLHVFGGRDAPDKGAKKETVKTELANTRKLLVYFTVVLFRRW